MRAGYYTNLREMLIRHEGLRLFPYTDTVGKLTIGVGRNLSQVGITKDEALQLLANDILRVARDTAQAFSWYAWLNTVRQDVVLNMVFNLGLEGFKQFKSLIAALTVQNYEKAATEMIDSIWAKQVGLRSTELAQMMRSGIYV